MCVWGGGRRVAPAGQGELRAWWGRPKRRGGAEVKMYVFRGFGDASDASDTEEHHKVLRTPLDCLPTRCGSRV